MGNTSQAEVDGLSSKGQLQTQINKGGTSTVYYYIDKVDKNKNILNRGINIECNIKGGSKTGYEIDISYQTDSGFTHKVKIGKYNATFDLQDKQMTLVSHDFPSKPDITNTSSFGSPSSQTVKLQPDNYTRFTILFTWPNGVQFARCSLLASYGDEELKHDSNYFLSSKPCPLIKIWCHTEVMYGTNLTTSVYKIDDGSVMRMYMRRPNIVTVIRGKETAFSAKMYYFNVSNGSVEDLTEGVLRYVMLRYFLWFLATGRWCIAIAKRKYSSRFTYALSQSPYACWGAYLEQPAVANYSKYVL